MRFSAMIWPAVICTFIGAAITFWGSVVHMTQKQLAAAAHLCESAVKRLEAGRKRGGWTATLELLCEAMGIKLIEHVAVAQRLADDARDKARKNPPSRHPIQAES